MLTWILVRIYRVHITVTTSISFIIQVGLHKSREEASRTCKQTLIHTLFTHRGALACLRRNIRSMSYIILYSLVFSVDMFDCLGRNEYSVFIFNRSELIVVSGGIQFLVIVSRLKTSVLG